MTHIRKQALSILITDDIAHNRLYITDILREINTQFVFTEAQNGHEAVNKVTGHIELTGRSFDLIIMDFQMPELNGARATAAIREVEATLLPPTQHSVILTWSTSLQSAYPQADDWLPKMTSANEVKAKLALFDLLHGD